MNISPPDTPCFKQLAAWKGMPNGPLIIVFKPAAAQHSIAQNNSSTFMHARPLLGQGLLTLHVEK